MKRLVVFLIGLFLAFSLYSQTITSTTAEVCDTRYQCYGSGSNPSFEGADLGNISALEFNGGMSISSNWGALTASMYYRIDGGAWKTVVLDKKTVASEGGGDARLSITDPIEEDPISTNSLAKTLGDITSYTRTSDLSVNTASLTNGTTYDLDIVHAVSGTTVPSDTSTADYSATFTKISDISFTDGSSFTPSITKGNENELIGRFWLSADVAGANLTDLTLDINGARTGFSNFELWASTNAAYDVSDTQLGSTIAIDPQASAAEFSSFSMAIPTGGTYILLTADVAFDATGSVQGVIGETSDLTVTDGEINETITNALMSNGGAEVPTPIELASFTAEAVQGRVELNWTTESETENSHFLVYRDDEVIGRVDGHGTTSETHDYAYIDALVVPGTHEYIIADVTYGGVETKQAPVNVEIESHDIEADFVLNKAYPNPFNPSVTINYQLSTFNKVSAFIYNAHGNMIKELLNDEMDAGSHTLTWNADGMPSGVYIVKMLVGDVMQSQKLVLMK